MSVCKMFTLNRAQGSKVSFNQYTVSGSTYEPKGDLYLDGQKIKGSDQEDLKELATICARCNETALTVLVEKLNVFNTGLGTKSPDQLCSAANDVIKNQWKKTHTLEFSRDRKSMSVYCVPQGN